MKQSDERLLALVKAAMDVVVAIGLLQLAPKKVTPRVTGALGFVTSLISCYQVVAPACLCVVVQVLFRDGIATLMFRVLRCFPWLVQQLPSRAPVAKVKA
jgi:hypothetical protein